MGDSSSSSDEMGLKKGPWAAEEDAKLLEYINKNGYGNWRSLPERAGLKRCGKSCRLRWTNYLRPDIKRGNFSDEEERTIIKLHQLLGNKWSKIATHLPGRTDNEIKNYWNTHIRKKFLQMGLDPITHKPRTDHLSLNNLLSLSQLLCLQQFNTLMGNNSLEVALKLQADAAQIAQFQLSQNLLQIINSTKLPTSQKPNFQLDQGLFNGVPAEGSLVGYSSAAGHGLVLSNNSLFDDHNSTSVGVNKYPSLSNNSSFDAQTVAGGQLPALVSPETSTGADQSRKSNMDCASTSFEAWDKVMDDGDEASGAYWKDLLDWTSSPSSPASWQQQLQ